MSGMKYDEDKLQWHLLRKGMTESLEGVVKVLMFGAKKYAEDSWQTVPNAEQRYRNALDRHLAAQDKGEIIDPETGLPHAYHVACNSLFLAWFESKKKIEAPWEKVETQPLHDLSGTAGLYPHAKNLCQSKNCEPIQETIGKQLAAEVNAHRSRIAEEQDLRLMQEQIEKAMQIQQVMGADKK